jgi:hypothetical protein
MFFFGSRFTEFAIEEVTPKKPVLRPSGWASAGFPHRRIWGVEQSHLSEYNQAIDREEWRRDLVERDFRKLTGQA